MERNHLAAQCHSRTICRTDCFTPLEEKINITHWPHAMVSHNPIMAMQTFNLNKMNEGLFAEMKKSAAVPVC